MHIHKVIFTVYYSYHLVRWYLVIVIASLTNNILTFEILLDCNKLEIHCYKGKNGLAKEIDNKEINDLYIVGS